MAKAMLHSLDRDGTHRADLVDVEILERVGNNDYIVRTPASNVTRSLIPSRDTTSPMTFSGS